VGGAQVPLIPMAHLALARKWRPQRFEDVVGQKGTVLTLQNAIASGRLAQSFIFSGPRGVGKTTTARILARALNCVDGPRPDPCGRCDACTEIAEGRDVDVMEIDGATYTGVDAVREVIVEPLGIAPMRDRFKIFIIDEVHRLSKSAFDALLKSIEEPPPYVKFMMATTDPGNVPDTIVSRSQVFELQALPFVAIRDQLRAIAADESVTIDEAALGLVARAAEGSLRDALSALDQVLAFTATTVTAADVSTVLGVIGRDRQLEIAETVAREDAGAIFVLADEVVESGFDLRIVCRELQRLMRDLLVVKIDPARLADPEIAADGERDRVKALADRYSREDLMRSFDLLSRAEFEIRGSSHPRHHFEMALVKWMHLRQLTPLSELLTGRGAGADRPVAARQAGTPLRAAAPPRADAPPRTAARVTASPAGAAPEAAAPLSEPAAIKGPVLAAIREENKVFYGMVVAQAQKVEVEGDALAFTFAPIHKALKSQLEAKRAWVEALAQSATGRRVTVVIRESPAAPAAPAGEGDASRQADLKARARAQPTVQAVLDVFGGEIEAVDEDEGDVGVTR
jgi:DNA polymerase-3 subunit gamma/tau